MIITYLGKEDAMGDTIPRLSWPISVYGKSRNRIGGVPL
nr:MAG TPA_asm: hypothetical protein [Caudoviricetes sp.]